MLWKFWFWFGNFSQKNAGCFDSMLTNRVGCKVQVSAGVLCNPSGVQTQGWEPLVCIINRYYLITFIKSLFFSMLSLSNQPKRTAKNVLPLRACPRFRVLFIPPCHESLFAKVCTSVWHTPPASDGQEIEKSHIWHQYQNLLYNKYITDYWRLTVSR